MAEVKVVGEAPQTKLNLAGDCVHSSEFCLPGPGSHPGRTIV